MSKRKSRFMLEYPALVKQWVKNMNLPLTPYDVTPGAKHKVWWSCERGHKWLTPVRTRTTGHNCPYCSGRMATPENSLANRFPELVAIEWDTLKNFPLIAENVTYNSDKKVWWKCKAGHEWQAPISNRARKRGGTGCPGCSGRQATTENSLAVCFPKLVEREWHTIKNFPLIPERVKPGSDKKVWWHCKNGHEWQAPVDGRNKRNTKCPFCSHKLPSKEYNLAVKYPALLNEWADDLNSPLTAYAVTPHSHYKAWWRCLEGHVWQASISNRTRGNGCPGCRSKDTKGTLADEAPHLVSEWDYDKNIEDDPYRVNAGAGKKAWWKCKAGHEWQAAIHSRARGARCPYCSHKLPSQEYNLAVKFPALLKEWNKKRNHLISPFNILPGCVKKVWWKCKAGHEWQAAPNSRTQGRNCLVCWRIKIRKCRTSG